MYRRLYAYLEKLNFFYPFQFGFREKHSTGHALISMTEEIRNTIDKGNYGCGVFIDLKKAFDTVNHSILLKKLEHYGIRGVALDWFCSYLSNRKQYVSVNGHISETLQIRCGVPQGSVLGPLLFLIYINDLPTVNKCLTFYLFADDTNIYFEASDLFTLQKVVNRELRHVKKWLDANKLALNVDKTNFVSFHSHAKKLTEPIALKFGREKISQADHVRFLGVLLDETLGWKPHHRFIAGSSKCKTKDLSCLLTKLLSTIKDGLVRYCNTKTSRNGVNNMWILKNSTSLLSSLDQLDVRTAKSVQTFDFSTLYTSIPHDLLKSRISNLVHNAFRKKDGSVRYTHIKLTRAKEYFTHNINGGGDNMFTADSICEMIEFLIDNIFVQFGGRLFRQVIGIPMGTNCAPLLADLFLYSYENEFLDNMIRSGHRRLARSFNLCYRYIDDLIVFNNKKFLDYLKEIYPSQLTVEKANKSDHLADYLDLTFIIDSGGKLSTRLYDKRDDFDFHIVNFPFLSSNIPSGPSYGVYISQLIRYARCCSHYDDFRYRHKCLVDRLLSQGYKALRLEKSFKKFYGRYQDLIEKYRRSVNAMVSDSFPGQFLFNM